MSMRIGGVCCKTLIYVMDLRIFRGFMRLKRIMLVLWVQFFFFSIEEDDLNFLDSNYF